MYDFTVRVFFLRKVFIPIKVVRIAIFHLYIGVFIIINGLSTVF